MLNKDEAKIFVCNAIANYLDLKVLEITGWYLQR